MIDVVSITQFNTIKYHMVQGNEQLWLDGNNLGLCYTMVHYAPSRVCNIMYFRNISPPSEKCCWRLKYNVNKGLLWHFLQFCCWWIICCFAFFWNWEWRIHSECCQWLSNCIAKLVCYGIYYCFKLMKHLLLDVHRSFHISVNSSILLTTRHNLQYI